MAKKKITLGEIYSDILAKPGMLGRWAEPLKLSDCAVIGFKFNSESDARCFYYDMMEEHIPYLFVDFRDNIIAFIVLRNEQEETKLKEKGIEMGGIIYKVALNSENI